MHQNVVLDRRKTVDLEEVCLEVQLPGTGAGGGK